MQVNPNIPVFGFIGRLEEQKGVDILTAALPEVAKTGGCQIVILGTGKKMLEQTVLKLDKQYPDIVKGVVKFDVPLAHLMTAGIFRSAHYKCIIFHHEFESWGHHGLESSWRTEIIDRGYASWTCDFSKKSQKKNTWHISHAFNLKPDSPVSRCISW